MGLIELHGNEINYIVAEITPQIREAIKVQNARLEQWGEWGNVGEIKIGTEEDIEKANESQEGIWLADDEANAIEMITEWVDASDPDLFKI